jgi:hypothetical protein
MLKTARAGRFMWLGILIGCGGVPSTSNPGPPPPHGGTIISLPNGKGFVEVVKKSGTSRAVPTTSEVAFYFFKDTSTPYSPAPTVGTLTVNKNKKVVLKTEGDALVTPPGPPLFENADVDGALSVDLAGGPVTIPLGLR